MSIRFQEYFRCPNAMDEFRVSEQVSPETGFFKFGKDVVCFGQAASANVANSYLGDLEDSRSAVQFRNGHVELPFDPDQIADNLRQEIYTNQMEAEFTRLGSHPTIRAMYYWGRPLLPVPMRSVLQRFYLRGEMTNPFPVWPVDRTVETLFERMMALAIERNGGQPVPFIWFWPDGAPAAFILTHDVESQTGRDFVPALMDLDERHGFKAAVQFVPEKRYDLPAGLLQSVRDRGFEVNVHDLNHDGNLFREKKEFLKRAERINEHVKEFGSGGFRSGALYRNPLWYDAFHFSYDMSIPNVGHLDPQGGGCCTTFPYFIGDIVEIPVTCTQDYSLFHILNQFSTNLWKQQFETIFSGHGMISVIIHPDYIFEQRAQQTYSEMLDIVRKDYVPRGIWATLPSEINKWWRQRQAMTLVPDGSGWQIEGVGNERARVAFANVVDGKLSYSFDITRGGTERSAAFSPVPAATSSQMDNTTPRSQSIQQSSFSGASLSSSTLERPLPQVVGDPSDQRASIGKLLPHQPLRIAMVGYTFYETDNRVMRYAETLARRGDHVDVFALRASDRPSKETINGVHVHRIQGRVLNEKSRFSYAWRLGQFFLRALYHVSRSDLRESYDLLHVHSVPDFLVFTTLLPRLRGAPVILDIHDILPEFYASKFGSNSDSAAFKILLEVEKSSTKFASYVIIANDIWKERLLSRSVPAEKCTVVLNAPDRTIFTRSSPQDTTRERFTLLYPGSLNWHQGLDIAIRAFAKIADKVPHADFYVIGDGPSKLELVQLTKSLGLANRIFLPASKPLREIAQVMETADLGIVPKRKDNFGNEAFSTKILEFMAMGVPVIVSDTKVDKLYFDDSVVTFFRGGDENDLAERMFELITDPQVRRQQTDNASDFVNKIDWTAKQHEYLELVDSLATRGNHKH
jgi:glycosyltransferase involved in cell wall biosynthesis